MTKSELCMDLSKKFSEIPMNKIDSSCGLYAPYMIANEPECGACVGAYMSNFLGVDRGESDDFIIGATNLAELLGMSLPDLKYFDMTEFDSDGPTHADHKSELSMLLHECGAPRGPFCMEWTVHPETVFRNMADKFIEQGE